MVSKELSMGIYKSFLCLFVKKLVSFVLKYEV